MCDQLGQVGPACCSTADCARQIWLVDPWQLSWNTHSMVWYSTFPLQFQWRIRTTQFSTSGQLWVPSSGVEVRQVKAQGTCGYNSPSSSIFPSLGSTNKVRSRFSTVTQQDTQLPDALSFRSTVCPHVRGNPARRSIENHRVLEWKCWMY